MMEIKKKIEKDIEGGRENLKEYKNDLKQEIEKVEIEKDISMSINLPYVIILPSALAGLLGSILLDLKIYFITIFVVVAYIFVCYCILIPMSNRCLKSKRAKLYFLNTILDLLNDIENNILKNT